MIQQHTRRGGRPRAVPPGGEPLVRLATHCGYQVSFGRRITKGGTVSHVAQVYQEWHHRKCLGRLDKLVTLSEVELRAYIASKFADTTIKGWI